MRSGALRRRSLVVHPTLIANSGSFGLCYTSLRIRDSSMTQSSDPPAEMDQLTPERIEQVREHVKAVLSSHAFEGSKRAGSFLQLVVERALAGRYEELRERVIGAEMFGRPIDYDTANDAVVRVKATEVRKRLAQHYHELKVTPPVRIELPAGSYVPRFVWRAQHEIDVAASESSMASSPDAPTPVPSSQDFVTIAQELPDAFSVVLGALHGLQDSTETAPISAPRLASRMSPWVFALSGLVILLSAVLLFLLLTHKIHTADASGTVLYVAGFSESCRPAC